MVDPRVLHQVTVEMTTGFLVLAGVAVAVKLLTDLWLRRFTGRFWTLDRWGRAAGAFAEPASFVALTAGVFSSFVTSWTGLNVWPSSMLWSSPTVHNKMLLVALSTTLFLGAFILRARFRGRIWRTPTTGAFYALLVLAGNVFLVLQNSVGGHLQGTGSILDPYLQMVNLDETVMWTFPQSAALACILVFPLASLLLGLRLRASNRFHARRELVPLAQDVKGLLSDARRADLAIDTPRRLIGRANFAARRGKYAHAVRLLEKAKLNLAIAHPFSGSVEGVELWAGIGPGGTEEPPALRGQGSARLPGASRRSLPAGDPDANRAAAKWAGQAGLPHAAELVERSLSRFEDAPIIQLQQELRWARDALLELKVRGRDLTEPVRMLKAAHEHIVRAEWSDAVRVLEQFRNEMGQVVDAKLTKPGRRSRAESPGPSTDDA